MRRPEPPIEPAPPTEHRPTVTVVCDLATVAAATTRYLAAAGLAATPDAPVVALIDAPVGFALHALESGPCAGRQRVVVMTWNPCPEYWEDLWEFSPAVLVAQDLLDVRAAVALAARGGGGRFTPEQASPLTACERRVLRLLAHGRDNQQIARALGIRHQSVRNVASAIYRKLDLSHRGDALLYYWGIWRWGRRAT